VYILPDYPKIFYPEQKKGGLAMWQKSSLKIKVFIFLFLGIFLIVYPSQAAQKKILTFEDIMKFKEIRNPVISESGLWLAYGTQPDRGDGEAVVHGVENGVKYVVERGSRPRFTKDARWIAMFVQPKAVEMEKAPKDRPKQGMAILETSTGEVLQVEKVQSFALSDDSSWIAYLHHKEEEKPPKKEEAASEGQKSSEEKKKETKKETGSLLVLRRLENGKEKKMPNVLAYSFDNSSQFLCFTVSSPEASEDGLYYLDLTHESLPQEPILQREEVKFSGLSWAEKDSHLAFLASAVDGEEGHYSLWIWDGNSKEKTQAVGADAVPVGWMIPENNRISWSKDGKRLFFGFKPLEIHQATLEPEDKDEKKAPDESELFDTQKILEKRELDVWHWNDPLIKTNDKIQWSRTKNETYTAVYYVDSKRFVQLADRDMPQLDLNDNPDFALGRSDIPYQKQITWYGRLEDLYLVNLKDGKRKNIAARLEDRCSLSPEGRYVAYFHEKHWFLSDGKSGKTLNLTEKIKVPFFDEDHDYPGMAPSYGTAGWGKNDEFVLINDKYDIWQFMTATGEGKNITGGFGRQAEMTFRALRLDREKQYFEKGETLLLSSYHNKKKNHGFYSSALGKGAVTRLLEENKKFQFSAKAKKADVLMYTRESFEEFPDLWVADLTFSSPKKISDVNPQIQEFAWGTPELVEWSSLDGIPLQGVLIKPAGYEKGKRYPVIVYFYRFFSQRMYEFNQMVVNHRPNFPFYTSNGYAVFLPDVRFDVGRPGYASTKCLVPGVQKLIAMGIADPKGIGIHGHSWSGYQAAFVITQTNIFSAAVAGAPVSNMTSAYSGIRWGSGLARQMQYEKQQSRIGGSLWEYPERYIENSPVFFADRIQTPLLIQFGDEDGAVPWYQGIELYLAMRRLQKDCVFLQYRGEPHHLQKYANKLDYSIKMKEYFDHYLKGMPAPDWIRKGVPYLGK
jgi:dipeptidyl aminopeptidase/acylaminoacyl peptidase